MDFMCLSLVINNAYYCNRIKFTRAADSSKSLATAMGLRVATSATATAVVVDVATSANRKTELEWLTDSVTMVAVFAAVETVAAGITHTRLIVIASLSSQRALAGCVAEEFRIERHRVKVAQEQGYSTVLVVAIGVEGIDFDTGIEPATSLETIGREKRPRRDGERRLLS